MSEDKTQEKRDNQTSIRGLPFTNKILNNVIKQNDQRFLMENAFNNSFADKNKKIDNNKINNSNCNYSSAETKFLSKKSTTVSNNDRKDFNAISSENNKEQKKPIPSIFNNISTLSFNKNRDNHNTIQEKDLKQMETGKIQNQKRNESNAASNYTNNLNNNSSALDSKFVTIDTSSAEKNYNIHSSCLSNKKKISQSNKKEFSRLNRTNSNNGSRGNSKEKSKEKANINTNSNSKAKNKKDNLNVKHLDEQGLKNIGTDSKLNKKEVPIHDFTFKKNNNSNNRENFETVKVKKKVFSPENVSFEANNFTSKNVLKESGNKRDLGKITFNFNSKLNQDSKILPDVPIKDTKFKLNSKLKNSSKGKLRDNSANSRISHSFSKEKREGSGCVGSSVGRRIDSKGRNREESLKGLNNNSHCGDDNYKKLKLIKNEKIQNLPKVKIEYIAKKPCDHYQKSCSSKSKFTNDNRTTLEHEDPSENLSNEKIVYLHTDVYNDRNPLEKSHKVNNKLNLKNLEAPNSSKLPTPNSSTITNNTNNSKNSKNLLYFKNININNLSNFLENFNANKNNNKRPSQDEAKIKTQKTFETTSTNKILSSNDNNLSSSRNLNQKDLDYSISNIASSVPTESNLGNDKSPNCHNPKGNCDTSDYGLLTILKPESIKKLKESFKSNEVCTNNVAVESNKVPNDHIESYFNQGKSKLETKSKIKINNVNYSFNNTSLHKSNEKNKLTRILTYDNADSQSNMLKLKLNNFENHNSNATLKERESLNRDAARGSKNNSVNKNREKTKSNSRSKHNEKNHLENNNLRTPILSKENLKKLAKINLQGDEITNNSGFHSTSKKINDKNFCTLLANSTLNCSTAKANKSQNLCKIPILKNSSSKKNLTCNNAKRDLIPNEKADNLKNRRENKDVFCESKISKNSSKDKNRTNNTYNKISSKNNASSYDKKNDNDKDDDDDDKNKRRNSFEKTIHINHNFNHNINHNILINIENPEAVKPENLRDSLKKFYPAVASKKSKNPDPKKAAGPMTSKIRDYSDLNLINDQEYSEINIEYLHTDNPSIFGSENKFKKFMHTIETAKDNYMNLKNFNQVSNIFNNKTQKEQDNLDSRSSGKLDLEYLCAAKQNLSTSNNKNLNAFNSNCSGNKNNPSSSKNIGEMANIWNSVAYKNTGSHNKIFNNEIATKVSNPFLSKNSIKLNIDKNLNNNLNDMKINSENNSALSVSNNNTIISHKNNLIVNNKLNYYNCYNNNNNIKLDQSMKKSPNTSENVCNTISSNLIIESLKKNLLVKKPINKINNNNYNNKNVNEKKNEFYNSKDSVEQTDFSRGVVHTEPTQKINEKEFIDNLKSNFLDKNKKLQNLNLKEINNHPNKNINEGFNNKKLETNNNNNKIFTNLRGGSPLEALKSIANLDKNFDLTLSLKPKFLNSNNENVSLTLKGNFATISHDKERENFNSRNNPNLSNDKINNIPFEPKDYKYSSNEKLNIFNIPKKLDLVKNKPSLFETLNIKKSSKQKLSNVSNNIMTDEDSNVDGNSKISKKNSKTKLNSQSFKYSSSSKSKSHSNSQNKETLPKEKDLLEETISYIISDDEPSTRRNKNNTIFNTEESETQNVFQKSVHKINNSNDEVDFEKFYAEMNWKLMNNPSSSSNYK